MTVALVLIAVAVVFWYRHQRRPYAGASAAARARLLRTPLVRLASLVGISTAAGRLADRSDQGAAGERITAEHLKPLERQGWTVLHDRAMPTGRANLDHLLVSPTGVVVVVDSKKWHAGFRVRVVGQKLLHGDWDVTNRLRGLTYEADTVARVLGCPVIRVVSMVGAQVAGGEQRLDGIRIVPVERVAAVLRQLGARKAGRPGPHPGERAAALFPPHGRH